VTVPALTRADASAGQLVRLLAPFGYVAALVGLVTSFVSPFLPLFLSRDLHAGPGRVSLFLFAMSRAAGAAATAVGRVSDRPGARPKLLVVAALAGVVGYALVGLVRNYWGVLAAALTFAAVAGSLMPQVFAFSRERLDRTNPAKAAAGINALRSLFSLAWVAGPPLAAYLIDAIDFRGLFLVAAAMHVAVLPVILRLGAGRADERPIAADPEEDSVPVAPALSRGRLLRTSAAFVLMQTAASLGVTSMPFFVSEELHGTVGNAGLVLGLCAAVEIPLMLGFGALVGRWSLRRLVLLGAGTGVAYFAVMSATVGLWQVFAAQVLMACFIATVGGLGISYFQDLLPGQLGRTTTMFTNSQRLSAMLGGLVFGAVQVVGYRSAYLAGIALCGAGLAVLALTRPTPKSVS
jgi:MFS transporter, SET family, sugar efflux transporter